MAKPPEKIYFVAVDSKNSPGVLHYREKGGGKYTKKEAAKYQKDYLAKRGIRSHLYEGTVTWQEIEDKHGPAGLVKVWKDYKNSTDVRLCLCGKAADECEDLTRMLNPE